MRFTNSEIYYIANNFKELFADFQEYIPAKVNFLLQKNMRLLATAAAEIDQAKNNLIKHYGTLNSELQHYDMSAENIEKAQKEFNELLAIEQDLPIKTFSIDALEDIKFTPAQMQIIMFMIDEE